MNRMRCIGIIALFALLCWLPGASQACPPNHDGPCLSQNSHGCSKMECGKQHDAACCKEMKECRGEGGPECGKMECGKRHDGPCCKEMKECRGGARPECTKMEKCRHHRGHHEAMNQGKCKIECKMTGKCDGNWKHEEAFKPGKCGMEHPMMKCRPEGGAVQIQVIKRVIRCNSDFEPGEDRVECRVKCESMNKCGGPEGKLGTVRLHAKAKCCKKVMDDDEENEDNE